MCFIQQSGKTMCTKLQLCADMLYSVVNNHVRYSEKHVVVGKIKISTMCTKQSLYSWITTLPLNVHIHSEGRLSGALKWDVK